MCDIVRTPDLTVVQREGLVADVIGGSAVKTEKVVKKAAGGTLLLDEAYRLTRDSKKDFGHEAMETIMSAIEGSDNTTSDRPAFIFAGYPAEMENFVRANAGMASRVTEEFIFPDYSPTELVDILMKSATSEGFSFTPGVSADSLVGHVRAFGNTTTENARFSHKFLKALRLSRDMCVGEMLTQGKLPDEADLFVFTKHDVEMAASNLRKWRASAKHTNIKGAGRDVWNQRYE